MRFGPIFPLDINSPPVAALEPATSVAACFAYPYVADARSSCRANRGMEEMDLVMIGIGVVFLVIYFAYVKACDSL